MSGSLAPVPRGSKLTMSKSLADRRREQAEEDGKDLVPALARPPRVEQQRPGRVGGVEGRGAGHGHVRWGRAGVAVVDRDRDGAALEGGAARAGRPDDRRRRSAAPGGPPAVGPGPAAVLEVAAGPDGEAASGAHRPRGGRVPARRPSRRCRPPGAMGCERSSEDAGRVGAWSLTSGRLPGMAGPP